MVSAYFSYVLGQRELSIKRIKRETQSGINFCSKLTSHVTFSFPKNPVVFTLLNNLASIKLKRLTVDAKLIDLLKEYFLISKSIGYPYCSSIVGNSLTLCLINMKEYKESLRVCVEGMDIVTNWIKKNLKKLRRYPEKKIIFTPLIISLINKAHLVGLGKKGLVRKV